MSLFASYGWIVDVDHISSKSKGVLGPLSINPEIETKLKQDDPSALRWRCKDADGEIYYEGRYIGKGGMGFGPLEDFAMPNAGATDIEYFIPRTRQWKAL